MQIRKLIFVVEGKPTIVMASDNADLYKAALTALNQLGDTPAWPVSTIQVRLSDGTIDTGNLPISAYSKLQMMLPIYLTVSEANE